MQRTKLLYIIDLYEFSTKLASSYQLGTRLALVP